MILNMDESPYFWEYLPRKVVTPTLSKVLKGWKRGYHQCHSTLILTIAADGTILRPSLVLKRKTPYILKCANEINMDLLSSESGWADENIIVQWFKNTLLPYVKNNHCMLIWNTFEAHKHRIFEHFNDCWRKNFCRPTS